MTASTASRTPAATKTTSTADKRNSPFIFGATATSFTTPFSAAAPTIPVAISPMSMRLVKPLPRSKRRRTASDDAQDDDEGGTLPTSAAFPMPPSYFLHPPPASDSSNDGTTADSGVDLDPDGRDRDQQGNTKKRKVPAAAHHFRGTSSDGGGDTASDDVDPSDPNANSTGGGSGGGTTTLAAGNSISSKPKSKPKTKLKPKLSPAASAGLKVKEALKARKRLLASMLGPSVASEDSFALDLALSAPLNWHLQNFPRTKKYFSRSSAVKRRKLRSMARKAGNGPRCVLPSGEFTFASPSPAGERMTSVMGEISSYRARFNAELALLVAKQADAAKKVAAAAASSEGKRSGRRAKAISAGNTPSTTQSADLLSGGTKSPEDPNNVDPSKKKKKRSRRAADPHQIKNYIPSRLPSANGVPQPPTASQAALNLKNLVSPHPVAFLSAEPKPRRRRDPRPPTVISSLPPVQPEDEWICSFCEFNLFFGDELACRRAIRSRKKLLNRRRRARERAAAAASGQAKLLGAKRGGSSGGDDEDELPEEEREAKFADPAEVDARVAATVSANSGNKPAALRDKDKEGLTASSGPPSRPAGR